MSDQNAPRPLPGLHEFQVEQYNRALPLLLPLAKQGRAVH